MNKYKKFIKELGDMSAAEYIPPSEARKMFPELFEIKPEKGKWYWSDKKARINKSYLFNYQGDKSYGFCWEKDWCNDLCTILTSDIVPSTNKEVEEMLINEAKKRGFKNGVKIDATNIDFYQGSKNDMLIINDTKIIFEDGKLVFYNQKEGWNTGVFSKGKWATIIEQAKEMTVSDISKELGYEVKIVK